MLALFAMAAVLLPKESNAQVPTTTTSVPSDFPSLMPSIQLGGGVGVITTTAPTAPPADLEQDDKPTVPTFVKVNGRVDLEISPAEDLISGNTRWTFLESTRFFLEETFEFKIPKVHNITVEIMSQTRSQQQRERKQRQLRHPDGSSRKLQGSVSVLYLDLNITGTVEEPGSDGSPYNFDSELMEIFRTEEASYIQTLQASGDRFFDAVTKVEIPASPTLPPSPSPATAEPTVAELSPVADGDFPAGPPRASDDSGVDTTDPSGLSLPIIIGIALGATGLFVLIFLFCIRSSRKQTVDGADNMSFSSGPALSGVDEKPKRKSLFGKNNNANGHDVSATQKSSSSSGNPRELQSAASHDSLRAPASSDAGDSQSLALYSYVRGDDGQSYMGETLQGADSLSYAYSLDAGFEPSVMSGAPGANGEAAPIPTEIPQLARQGDTNSNIDTDDEYGLTDREVQYDIDNETIEISESDLKLTESEMAMLPADLMGSQSGSFGDMESSKPSSSHKDNASSIGGTTSTQNGSDPSVNSSASKITRCCFAPPGKLGIIIDTTVEGPVVHKVNAGSPLEGLVWKGDIIVKIDEVDTRAMSATAITNVMIKTAHQRRKLTIVSDANRK